MLKNGPSTFILVSGFHRSGTSLVAKTLQANGVNMGASLMGASFANKEGHYEDIPLVEVHDSMLAANGTNWQECKATSLSSPPFLKEKLQNYVKRRCISDAPIVGAKDPRALFFKQQWLTMTDVSITSLFVFRSWQYSVSSLLKRHSRELLQTPSSMHSRPTDYRFWLDPELAANMWLASAKAMLEWKADAPESTLVFPLSALVSRSEALTASVVKMGLPPTLLDAEKTVNGKLLHSKIPSSLLDMLSQETVDECDKYNEKLNAEFAHLEKETVTFYPVPWVIPFIESNNDEDSSFEIIRTIDLSKFEFDEALKLVNSTVQGNIKFEWEAFLNTFDLNDEQYEKIFFAALKRNELAIAELAIRRSLDLKPASWRWMYLGDIYKNLGHLEQAKHAYKKAIERMPKNATFYAKLAVVAMELNDVEDAKTLLENATSLDSEKPAVQHAVQKFSMLYTDEKVGANQTTHSANEYKVMSVINDYNEVVEAMTQDSQYGEYLDRFIVKSAFVMRNNRTWLQSGLSCLSKSAQKNLVDYLSLHAQQYWSDTVIETEFGTSEGLCLGNAKEPYVLPLKAQSLNLTVGVHIHVFYPHLLAEIYDFLRYMPVNIKTVITCPYDKEKEVKALLQTQPFTQVIGVDNKGRDIAPWLMVGAKLLRDCDMVLKLHTKSTPHDEALSGWRLQLLWSLLGDKERISEIITRFHEDENVGVVMAEYHPHIYPHVNWGQNREQVDVLSKKLNLNINTSDKVKAFPAGSMFWYRPASLRVLLDYPWSIDDFPDELAQTDGTTMHAIERIIPYLCNVTFQRLLN